MSATDCKQPFITILLLFYTIFVYITYQNSYFLDGVRGVLKKYREF